MTGTGLRAVDPKQNKTEQVPRLAEFTSSGESENKHVNKQANPHVNEMFLFKPFFECLLSARHCASS